jgi:hypothetical protein
MAPGGAKSRNRDLDQGCSWHRVNLPPKAAAPSVKFGGIFPITMCMGCKEVDGKSAFGLGDFPFGHILLA